MQTTLTLQLDEELIQKAQKIADESGKSVSQMVEDYFLRLDMAKDFDASKLGPITRSLMGSLKGATVDENDYYKYLEEKYK